MFRRSFLFILFFLILQSCDPNMVYDHFEKVENQNWKWDDVKVFEADIQDSLSFFNVFVNVRHTKEYPKANLYLFVTITSPQNNQIRDTIDLSIADKHGKWVGEGFGDLKFVRKKIKEQVRFAFKGKYTFEVEQGMRIPELPVTDVGIRIEKYKDLK